ncbi:MAG: TonB-dependent receptor [Verrucomicrobia bacterium]|nr:TonB-dependent receptor [Verrucomicrobiota bacterium]
MMTGPVSSFPRRFAAAAALLAALCLPPGLRADDTRTPDTGLLTPQALKRMTVEELLAQPVTSMSRRPEAWSDTAGNLFLIRGQSTFTTGAQTLPDLLRLAPDLFVAQKSSSEWGINARGFMRSNSASNKLLVMIDGRTVYSPLFSNVFWESTSTFLPDLERIEVITGPAGSTWGSNAVNGVINIQSKSARETVGGLAQAYVGTDTDSFAVRQGVNLGSNGALRVYVQGADHQPTLSSTGADDDYDAWHSTQWGFRGDWGRTTTGDFTLQGDMFNAHYRKNPELVNDAFNLLARWSRDFTPDSQLWIRAYHDFSRTELTGSNREITHSGDLEFQHRLKLTDDQELLWGADYRLQEDSISNTAGFTIQPADVYFGLVSVFAQHELSLARDQLRLTTGLRLEENHYSGWEYMPSVRLAWPGPERLVWLAASRAVRIPSRFDADYYAPETPPYSLVAGGPDFKAEVVYAYELGWRAQPTSSISLTATAYYHDYRDLRSLEPSGPAILPITIGNGVAGRSHGVEAFADWDVTSWWRLRAGGFVMHQETWLTAGGGDLERGLGEVSFPGYQAQLRNTLRIGNKVTFWASLRHVAEVPVYENGQYGRVPAYTELDATLTWAARANLDFSLSGRNLLDAAHPEIGAFADQRQVRRSVEAGVRFKY